MCERLNIENKQWSVKNLVDLLPMIIKPKFQRKGRWVINPQKKKCPSYSEYIKFLYRTKNSVDVLSFGTIIKNNKQNYINIDGNNRINAIVEFVRKPLLILHDKFSDKLNILNKYIDNDILYNIQYDEICDFRRLKDITPINEIVSKLSREEYDIVEDIFVEIQENLLLNDKSKFTECVKLNINIFNDGSYDEYNNIFKSINTHSNELSENELLASMLYSNNIILKPDNNNNFKLIQQIKSFYDNRDKNEVLCNSNNNNSFTNTINIFDYMVGLQNLLNKENSIIPEYNTNGLGLIFKLYKIVYNKNCLDNTCFNDLDTEYFTNILINMNNILANIFNKLFSNKLNNRLFGNSCMISRHFKKNNLYILCTSILSLLKNNYDNEYIINNLIKPVFYHMLIKYIPKTDEYNEEITILKDMDLLKYEAGGSYIDNQCKRIYKSEPHYLYNNINEELFIKILSKIIYHSNNITNEKLRVRNKRKSLNFVHKIIYSIIFKTKVPIDWLITEYSIEHIIPFSSAYEGELDLDRFGNLFPISLYHNKKRSNKNINLYNDICPEYYNTFIKKLCDDIEYNNIIEYNNKKPVIINNKLYEDLCYKNEKLIIDIIIKYLFSDK
jgi:hypothetical protein